MEQKPFDKAIRDFLKDSKATYNSAHWLEMEQLLNHLPVGDDTDRDAYFDSLVKDKIDNTVTSAHLSPNWSALEAGLEAVEKTDAQFDAHIYSRLRPLETSYSSRPWYKILARLEAESTLKEKLYRYKLLEATLMILFLLNVYQYLPSTYLETVNFPSGRVQLEVHSPEIFDEPEAPKKEISQSSFTNEPVPAVGKENLPGVVIAAPATTSDFETELPVLGSSESSFEKPLDRSYAIMQILLMRRTSIQMGSGLMISLGEMNRHLSLHTKSSNSLITTVPSLSPDFVESQNIIPLGCRDCKYSKIPARLRFGLISNLAINNVYRTGGQILDISTLNQKGFGYGSGFSLGFKYGRWEIETGLIYAAKQYDPNIIEQHGGIVSSGGIRRTHFQTIHLQTLHVPVNLRYNYAVLGKGKWHLYTQTGAALNVVLRAEYDLAEISSGSRSFSNAVTTSRLRQVNYNNGLLAGDGFKENRYLSISMGAGIERYIAPQWSMFIQPDFHFHFSGNRIGPTEDRINTLSLSFGARKSL